MKKILAFTFLVLIGCSEKEPEAVKLIDFGAVKSISAALLIEKAIPLETDTTALLSEFLMVKYDKDGFFVMNYDRPTGIQHFSKEGKYLGMVAEIGEAPGQVLRIKNFRLFEDVVQVSSGMGNSLEIYSFDKSGELLNTIPYPINAFAFYQVSEEEVWFYSSYNMVAGDHRLFVADGEGEVKKKLLPNDFNEKMLPFDEQAFFEGDDAVLFRESFKTSVYELSEGDSLKEVYKFDFGSTTVPDRYWEMEGFPGFEMISKQGFSNLNFLQETEKYLLADVVTQQERVRKRELYIWNKESGKEFKLEIDEEEQGYFESPIGIEGDQLVFIAYAPYLVRNSETLNLSPDAKSALTSVTEDSNPVIIYAKIPE
ncbi:6-bladed beta-propeller [Algoriphagus yeomjeoni]|uniref:6-bladed beta-propeller n=1 Tax=Algoriphagus yeomjeoni TaxID=291403 RepID=UPI003CE49DAB